MISATQATAQLKELLEPVTIASRPGEKLLEGKVVTANSTEGLVAAVKNAKKPCVGILYEGARPPTPPGAGGKQMGQNAELVFSLVVITEESVITKKVDVATPTHELLDAMRGAIMGKKSPTGHFWQWALEAKADERGGQTMWVQRWVTPKVMAPTGPIGQGPVFQ